eukprot:CAMPEP_0115725540 /NCGR_PEP_ID=MMETSP0272-20121206/81364_1 /TAXON_ID=71861 /ORGANISM="Scrippsiella trochoidea, Strain CCMP3099" /LENGTH=70 /DNA_ID=CAMNT_0003168833 /DNA_START=6 /DNA_END=218 /DNA_ORIENTATION=+
MVLPSGIATSMAGSSLQLSVALLALPARGLQPPPCPATSTSASMGMRSFESSFALGESPPAKNCGRRFPR